MRREVNGLGSVRKSASVSMVKALKTLSRPGPCILRTQGLFATSGYRRDRLGKPASSSSGLCPSNMLASPPPSFCSKPMLRQKQIDPTRACSTNLAKVEWASSISVGVFVEFDAVVILRSSLRIRHGTELRRARDSERRTMRFRLRQASKTHRTTRHHGRRRSTSFV